MVCSKVKAPHPHLLLAHHTFLFREEMYIFLCVVQQDQDHVGRFHSPPSNSYTMMMICLFFKFQKMIL